MLALAALACGGSSGTSKNPTATPNLSPVTFSGSGDEIVDCSAITGKGYTKAELTHDGKANFLVVPYDADNERKISLVNEIGVYDGTVRWDNRAASLEVKADGKWTITISR